MEAFADLAQFAMPAAIVGGVLFFLGFLLKANAKKETASSVISTMLLTVGVILLLFAFSTWITQWVTDWDLFSKRMMSNVL